YPDSARKQHLLDARIAGDPQVRELLQQADAELARLEGLRREAAEFEDLIAERDEHFGELNELGAELRRRGIEVPSCTCAASSPACAVRGSPTPATGQRPRRPRPGVRARRARITLPLG